MNICLFEKEEIGLPLSLRDERAVHILKILHKKVGDSFRAGILDGEEGEAKITKIEKFARKSADGKKSFDDGALYFSFEAKNLGKKLYPLKMIIGFPRPIQLKRLLRDMAGLGVCEIHLCGTDLVEKSYLNSDLADENELHKLLLEGTVQAGGTFVPKVFLYKSLDECLRNLRDESGGSFEGLAVKKLAVGEGSDGSLTKRELVAESAGLTARTGGFVDASGNLQSGSKTSSSISENLRARSGNLRSDRESSEKSENSRSDWAATAKLTLGEKSENLQAKIGENSLTKRELVAESAGLTARTGGETKYFALDNVNPKSSLVQELALWTDGGLSEKSGDLTAKSENLTASSENLTSISENLRARSGNLRSDRESSEKSENSRSDWAATAKLTLGEKSENLQAKIGENSLTKRELVAESAGLTARTGGETKYFALDNVNPKSSLVQELALWTDGGLSEKSGDLLSNCESSVSVALGEEKIGLSAISENLTASSENFPLTSDGFLSDREFSASSENLRAKSGGALTKREVCEELAVGEGSDGSLTKRELVAESAGLTARTGGFVDASENLRAKSGNLRSDWVSTVKTAYAAIGSERGWSERERKLLESFGFVRCGLGSRVLRTETAATVAATLILAKMNFL